MSALTHAMIDRARASLAGRCLVRMASAPFTSFESHPLTGGGRITPAAGLFNPSPSAVPVGSHGAGMEPSSVLPQTGEREDRRQSANADHLFHHGGHNA